MDVSKIQEMIHDQPYVSSVLLALGTFTVARLLYQTLSVLLQTFVLPGQSLSKFGAKKGAWAVVTGSTDGIGKEFALQLGKAGFNVLLVARNVQLLKETAQEIESKYNVKTRTHSIDFAKADAQKYAELTDVLQQLDIGVLVNNVGKSHAMPAYLVDTPQDEITDIVTINVNATLQVTYAALPGMAFLATFTSALAEEVRKDNIVVEHLNTYFVVSKLSKIRKPTALVPLPKAQRKDAPPALPVDYRAVSRIHFDELNRYLADYLAKAAPNSRTTARQKLTRLTIQQFHELSTDVYDELVRRQNNNEVPFLPVKEEFHPKRNQARQKLATLPAPRFEDLSSDVYFELARRYPEFKEDPAGGRASAGSNYDDYPAPGFPTSTSPPRSQVNSRISGRTSADRPSDSMYGGSASSRRPSEDRRRPSEDYPMPRRSEDNYRRPDDSFATRMSEDGFASSSSRRKPSQDTSRRSEDRERSESARRPSASASMSGNSDSTATISAAQSATAMSAMIIPAKSTIEEEDIRIPYGQDKRESGSTTMDERSAENFREHASGFTDGEPDSASDYHSPRSPPAGLGGLAARLRNAEETEDEGNASGQGAKSGGEEHYGRASVNSDRGGSGLGSRMRGSISEDQEKMRRDYEYKVATMQSQIANLTRELGEVNGGKRNDEVRLQAKVDELENIRWRLEEQTNTMRSLQKELDELKELRQRDKERESRRMQDESDELRILRERVEELEGERQGLQIHTDKEIVDQLRSDIEGLMLELSDLSRRNDELMTAKENDLNVIRDLDVQLKEYKRKYEQAKTELRNVKATSQLYSQGIKVDRVDDQLPVSQDGGILDIHMTAFVSAIDSLLVAGRSNAPTRVLTPMKTVVNAVTNIADDTRSFERRPARERADVDIEALRALRERAEATLSNLVAVSKTHATSSGMAPVSLLDAAASHVSMCVTEIAKTVLIRKATRIEVEQFPYSMTPVSTSGGSPSPSAGFAPMRAVEELRSAVSGHGRKGSASSSSGRSPGSNLKAMRRPTSDQSSSEQTSSPPPIFDRQTGMQEVVSDDSGPTESSEDAWSELKPYLDAQTESIVYAIQSVLSGVRNPTPSTSVLHENITQIITIVSSIVAVCKDNIPPASVQQGQELLSELSEHANNLSEVQALAELTKESRQTMAKSSFAIANAMKGLMKL
ncbi:hypothetical protein P691DRAFT_790378 [Macrolepiota fuliginosa MF-IS2]|uniref:GIT Spa2 homology (SHD) domain-containing protein n=1 Tax=Macrolepiota fuliginosa MF-IS2 TaxID=1400762 RepID=A0A9P5XQP3_9AGAR|nr:hypothetical protein P691DRAFT_790378 [Macrolepiota fuliginosa MF-IS2]